MTVATYTFIANHKGGIYVRQVDARNIVQACRIWADGIIKGQDIEDLDSHKFFKSFHDDIEDLPPVGLESTPNVWGFSVGSGKNFMLVNIIRTDMKIVETPSLTQVTEAM